MNYTHLAQTVSTLQKIKMKLKKPIKKMAE
jgi:hypothetical protein